MLSSWRNLECTMYSLIEEFQCVLCAFDFGARYVCVCFCNDLLSRLPHPATFIVWINKEVAAQLLS